MMFSKSCEYAIKAVIHLCIETKDGSRLSIAEIAEAIDSPEPFTAKILQTLVRHDIISSAKGPGGGFYIDHHSKPVFVIEIIDVIDGKHAFERCGLGLKECNEKRPCPIHNEFASYSRKLKRLLETKTIQDLAKGIISGKAFLSNT
ncbi:MAG: Rrf2 family transcriptional regulator [Chitinophagales bacterium]|nr:Rrf2 family transcriptional regulator [Chitinophagales bacterium]